MVKQVMYPIVNFLKKQWLSPILIAIYLVLLFISNTEKKELLQKEKELSLKIKNLKEKDKESLKKILELSKKDTIYLDSIVTIKIKGDEKIHYIDRLPLSGLQQYFTDRYPQR